MRFLTRFLILFLFLAPLLPAVDIVVTYSTPGTFTWTAPPGTVSAKIECWGAGGHGGSGGNRNETSYSSGGQEYTSSYSDNPGGGGGGGAYARKNSLAVSAGQSLTVVVPGSAGTNASVTGASTVCQAASGQSGTGGYGPILDHWQFDGFNSLTPIFSDDGYSGTPGNGGLAADSVGDVKTSGAGGDGWHGGNSATGQTANVPPGGGGNGGRDNTDTGGQTGAVGRVVITYTVLNPAKLIVVTDQ